jgi:hypothetical protein
LQLLVLLGRSTLLVTQENPEQNSAQAIAMGSALENLGVSAGINLGLAAIFVACYSVASRLPINTRVYFPALFQV